MTKRKLGLGLEFRHSFLQFKQSHKKSTYIKGNNIPKMIKSENNGNFASAYLGNLDVIRRVFKLRIIVINV